jgi:hypothetical protein
MDERDPSLHRDHFDGVFAYIKVEDRSGVSEYVPEGTCGLDDCAGAFIVETGQARGHVHFSEIFVESDTLNLGALPNPDPAPVRRNQFGHAPASRKERIFVTEWRVPDQGNPVPLLRNIPEQFTLDMIDAAHYHCRRICGLGWRNPDHKRDQSHQGGEGHKCKTQRDTPCHPPFHDLPPFLFPEIFLPPIVSLPILDLFAPRVPGSHTDGSY